jgi:hypothetical protein
MARGIRMAGWLLAVALAVLGLGRIGWQRLSHTITTALYGLGQATMLMVDAGWPLLLIAIAIALGLTLKDLCGVG